MILSYLQSVHRSGSSITDADLAGWAPPGEPVVPNFPTSQPNTFVSTTSFKTVPYAEVVEGEYDPDAHVLKLCAQFPGLPKELHEAYVLETVKCALNMKPGTVVQVYTGDNFARIAVVNGSDIHTLWTEQPIPQRYKQ